MCAVIGVYLQQPTAEDFEMVKRVFHESKIRGMHATGISFLPHWSDGIETYKEPVPADRFSWINRLADCVADDGNLYLIGHCRYSTSDLEFNQPMESPKKSIVHNGVITQELPENWKELYGYDTLTHNDSELILHSDDPLREFAHMSMGVVELYDDKRIRFYRNGKRPLYLTSVKNGSIITSTKDIAKRAGLLTPTEVLFSTYITLDQNGAALFDSVISNEPDLQEVNNV